MESYTHLLLRYGLNLIAILLLMLALYYPRHKKRALTVSAALFNSFAFAVLSVLSSVQFTVAAGFGLFAILALFTLRSEQIPKVDIAYFFGAISLAVITSIKGTELSFVVLMLCLLLIAVYFFDHPKLLPSTFKTRVTLMPIPADALGCPQTLHASLAGKIGG